MQDGPEIQFIIKLFLTGVIILFLTGCKLDLSTDLNIGDLLRSALSKINGIASDGTIKFEVGSIANCRDERKFFTSIIEKIFLDFKILPYEQVGM
ncbi:hypothetical protein OAS18_03495 [Nitrospinaceae bacterium]|nr:hypothetical protein [Nitrospinaceae bacterium]